MDLYAYAKRHKEMCPITLDKEHKKSSQVFTLGRGYVGHLFTFADFSVRGPLYITQEVCQSGQLEMKNLPSFEAWEAAARALLQVCRLVISRRT